MRAVSLTNRGGRKNNEDYVGYANSDKLWCFVVCDGLGGQSFGEVASEIVCETVCKSFKKHLNFRVRRYTDISKRRRLFWVRNENAQNRICLVRLLHW